MNVALIGAGYWGPNLARVFFGLPGNSWDSFYYLTGAIYQAIWDICKGNFRGENT